MEIRAKGYKLHDRLDPTELRRNADRLRPKDFADLYRLLLVIPPEEAARVFDQGSADPLLRAAVSLGRDYLIEVLDDSATVASMVADVWGDTSREGGFRVVVDGWRLRFAP